MKRLFWAGVGAATTVAALRKAREVTDKHVPASARSVLGAAAGVTSLARRAVAEFRAGSAEREAELRADLLAGADLTSSRVRVDAWRAERADRTSDSSTPDDVAPAGTARPGSAAATAAGRRPAGAHSAEDPDDGRLGYSFF